MTRHETAYQRGNRTGRALATRITDEMVERACIAFYETADSRVDPSLRTNWARLCASPGVAENYRRHMRAALEAALHPGPTVFHQDPGADSKAAAAYHGTQPAIAAVATTVPERPALMVLSEFHGEGFMTLTKWAKRITRYDDGTVKVAGPPMLDPLATEIDHSALRPMYNISPPESRVYMTGIRKSYPMGQLILDAAKRQGLPIHTATGSAMAGLGIKPITFTERTKP